MTGRMVLVAIFSVVLSSMAQLSLKIGATEVLAGPSMLEQGWANIVRTAMLNPYIIAGFSLYGGGAVFWLLVLSRNELSVAYPFVSLGLILTMALGAMFLNEQLNGVRVFGALLIVAGVFVVAKS